MKKNLRIGKKILLFTVIIVFVALFNNSIVKAQKEVPWDISWLYLYASELGEKGKEIILPDLPEGAHYGNVISQMDRDHGSYIYSRYPRISNCSIKGNVLTCDVSPGIPLCTTDIEIDVIGSKEYGDYVLQVSIMSVKRKEVSIDGVYLENAGEVDKKGKYSKVYDGKSASFLGTPIAIEKEKNEETPTLKYDYKWYELDEEDQEKELNDSPVEAGDYKLVVSVDDNDPDYKGETSYYLTINPKLVELPNIVDSVYTGKLQKAQIEDSDLYYVEENVGGIDVGNYDVVLTLKDSRNYIWKTGRNVKDNRLIKTFHITKTTAKLTNVPKANKLVYTGSPQQLVTNGKAMDGTLEYSLDEKKWSNTVPKATQVGTYKVYYRVVGNKNSINSSIKYVKVKILPKEDKNALNKGLMITQTKNKIKVSWSQVNQADGYYVYLQSADKKYNSKSINQVKGKKNTTIVLTKASGEKINANSIYKVYVEAYKQNSKKTVILSKSITGYVVDKTNKKFTNIKDIKLSKNAYTVNAGKKLSIKPKSVLMDKKKSMISKKYVSEFRYTSSDKNIAIVSSNGQIKTIKKGFCIIYVYAKNGYTKQINLIVK